MACKSHLNRVTKTIKSTKSKYNTKIVEENGDFPKAFWRTIKKFLPGETETDWRRSLTRIIIYFDEPSATRLWSLTGT